MAEFRDMRLRGVEENEHHGEDNRNEKAIQHAENRDREEGRDDEQPVPLPAEVGEQGFGERPCDTALITMAARIGSGIHSTRGRRKMIARTQTARAVAAESRLFAPDSSFRLVAE